MSAASIDTSRVTGRRELSFHTVNDILADAEMLGQAKQIRALGNWTPGQIFKHLAMSIAGAMDGFDIRVPWVLRLLGRWFFKQRVFRKGMPAGLKQSAALRAKLYPPDSITTNEGLQALREVVQRWNADPKRAAASPFFGPMTSDEWTKLQCRHAELHLSFLIPESG